MENRLHKYVCKNPFEYLDIQGNNGSYICCPSWCPTNISNGDDIGWDSPTAYDIRKSVLDGSYKHCDKNICPSLNTLLNTPTIPSNFVRKQSFHRFYPIKNIEDVNSVKVLPQHLLFGFDRSCNLKCPSCRLHFVPNDKKSTIEYQNKLNIIKSIEETLSENVRTILITGSGDPLYSNIYREYLQNFKKDKYPKLDHIKLITNGQMLTKKMWDSLSAKEFIKSIEVSVDAGTKETYENITRLNGDWDVLISNLKFLSSIKNLNEVFISFVVSEKNFTEMYKFYNIMIDIFKDSDILSKDKLFRLDFRQHVHWEDGAYTKQEVESIQVFNKKHHLYKKFLLELDKIHNKDFVNHNFNHLILKKNII